MSEAIATLPIPTDSKTFIMQTLATLPGHITGASIILYMMFVFMPERDAAQAALLTKQQQVHVEVLEKQRAEFMTAQRISTESFEKALQQIQDSCHKIRSIEERNSLP